MKLASNYPTRQQAVVDGGGLFVVVAASKRGAAAAERLADDRAKFAREGTSSGRRRTYDTREEFQRTTWQAMDSAGISKKL